MNKVLVIGGNGFIGMNIVKILKEKGQYVSIYDIKDSGLGYRNYCGNIKEDENFSKILNSYDVVIYLITTVLPKKSMEEPFSPFINDIPLLITTLDSCLKNNVKRVVFASSGGTIYGDSNGLKSKETDFNSPINHYAICKLACEKILELYNKLYGMENVSLRISNPYGDGQNPKSGVGAITTFIEQIKSGNDIVLFGDGSVTRDFIDVVEVADAFDLAVNWKYNSLIQPVFNIGSGQGISLKQIIDIVSSTLNIVPNIKYSPERPFDVKYNVLDMSKAKNYLNFHPSGDQTENIRQYVKRYHR